MPRLALIALGLSAVAGLVLLQVGCGGEGSDIDDALATAQGGEPPTGSADEPLPAVDGLADYDILPPAKQAIVDSELQRYQESIQGAQVTATPRVRLKNETLATPWSTGIFERGQAPFPSAMYQFENQWAGEREGGHVQAFAGALGQDPAQGVVVVLVISQDLRSFEGSRFLTPVKAGPVRITAADGERLALRAKRGDTFILDVAGGGFIEGP